MRRIIYDILNPKFIVCISFLFQYEIKFLKQLGFKIQTFQNNQFLIFKL